MLTRMILETFPGVDIGASLKYLKKKGGHCDCEVIYNVAMEHADQDAVVEANLNGAFQETFGYWCNKGQSVTDIRDWIQKQTDRFIQAFAGPNIA